MDFAIAARESKSPRYNNYMTKEQANTFIKENRLEVRMLYHGPTNIRAAYRYGLSVIEYDVSLYSWYDMTVKDWRQFYKRHLNK